jgi:hypothetical protein
MTPRRAFFSRLDRDPPEAQTLVMSEAEYMIQVREALRIGGCCSEKKG